MDLPTALHYGPVWCDLSYGIANKIANYRDTGVSASAFVGKDSRKTRRSIGSPEQLNPWYNP